MSQPLLHNSARVLEFDALRELLRGYASSPLGQTRITTLAPSTDSAWITEQQDLTTEVREFRRVGGRFDFSGLLDVTTMVKKSRIAGAVLETTDIRDVVLVVDRAAEWREIAFHPPANMKTEWRRTRTLSERIPDFTEFLRHFRNKIDPDGTLDDRASPELARIRREIEKQRRVIQQSLQGYLRRLAEGGAVQDELITIRGERFVIPVKIEQKRRVQGVVHGASSSGQTVFVEPLETIEQNNELVRLLDEEQAEIHRILLEMTRRIGEQAEAILTSAEVLSELELQFAKARFAEDYNCVSVQLSRDKREPCGDGRIREPALSEAEGSASEASLILHNARHPLLERNLKLKGAEVIPVKPGTGRPSPPASNHRPQHRRQNRNPENSRTARPDGAIRNPSSSRSSRAARIRRGARRHRRLSIHRAESLHFLRPRHQHRLHLAHRDRAVAGPAR